jgi:hypothetical protein
VLSLRHQHADLGLGRAFEGKQAPDLAALSALTEEELRPSCAICPKRSNGPRRVPA